MNQSTLNTKISTFAAAHPNAVICAMFHKSWRSTHKLTHIYYIVKDGQPARLPAEKILSANLPRYTLDLDHGCAWRDYTEQDVYARLLTFAHVNENHFNDIEWMKLREKCRAAALRLNRWLKNRRIADLRREGRLT